MGRYRLDLDAIESSLKEVQRNFHKINDSLNSRRAPLQDEIVNNMMCGYALVDEALAKKVDLFELQNAKYFLQMNHLVLCGIDSETRMEHKKHISETENQFYNQDKCNIFDIIGWNKKHRKDSAWKRASGVYIFILSQPQLYLEGNHRTGALIMSYILGKEGKAPFVLSKENAKEYFDPSTVVKCTNKNMIMHLIKLPKIKEKFAGFLKSQEKKSYIYKEK